MICRHENADHLKPGEWLRLDIPHVPPWRVTVEQLRCLDCGAWLSLGPSNDTPDEVRVEMRAAEIIAAREANEEYAHLIPPRDGWQFGWWLWNDERDAALNPPQPSLMAESDGTNYSTAYLSHYPGWPVGWLARVIDTTESP